MTLKNDDRHQNYNTTVATSETVGLLEEIGRLSLNGMSINK